MNPNALPVELRLLSHWVCWTAEGRDGKQTKVPLDPSSGGFASTADPDTWATFEEALDHARLPEVAGIGFVFTAEDPYVGIDLDDCRDQDSGELTEEAEEIVAHLYSYTEISPSGTGVHIIAKGELPPDGRRKGFVEMYDDGRFFTMTGDRVSDTPENVCERSEAIRSVHREYITDSATELTDAANGVSRSNRELNFEPRLSDEELLEKAHQAENGEKFAALWRGDTGEYDSHSEADMALCCLLAFWTEGDPARVDQFFRQSALMRPKWDEVHYGDGATYGERTVERACASTTTRYGETRSTVDEPN